MPKKDNRMKHCLVAVTLVVILLLAVPSTVARFTSRSLGYGQAMQAAYVDAALICEATGTDQTTLSFQFTGTASAGFAAVRYGEDTYYIYTMLDSDGSTIVECTVNGSYSKNDFVLTETGWGTPPADALGIAELETRLNAGGIAATQLAPENETEEQSLEEAPKETTEPPEESSEPVTEQETAPTQETEEEAPNTENGVNSES